MFYPYCVIAYKYVTNQKDSLSQYCDGYNYAAPTYSRWTGLMGKYTDNIIRLVTPYINEDTVIADVCCGTGYITHSIDKKFKEKCIESYRILSCDISDKMIETASLYKSDNIQYICSDVLDFLSSLPDNCLDGIYCGWAIYYFNNKHFFRECNRVLKNDAFIGIIANCKGTLDGIEEIFINAMLSNIDNVDKIMDVRFSIPSSINSLYKRVKKYGFSVYDKGEGSETADFETPEELLGWLYETGAIAGTKHIFRNTEKAMNKVIENIKKSKEKDGRYFVNHKFVYVFFRRGVL